MKYHLLIIFVFFFTQTYGQSIEKDFMKVYNNYLSKDNLNMDMDIETFLKDKTKSDLMKVEIRQRKNQYYSKLGDKEIINNGKYTLFVNHKSKTMVYNEGGLEYDFIDSDGYMEQLKTWLTKVDKSELIEERNGIKVYKVYMSVTDNSPIISCSITLNLKKNIIEKVVYNYNLTNEYMSAKRVIIKYKNVTFERIDNSYFKGDKYLNFGKEVTLQNSYRQYKLYAK